MSRAAVDHRSTDPARDDFPAPLRAPAPHHREAGREAKKAEPGGRRPAPPTVEPPGDAELPTAHRPCGERLEHAKRGRGTHRFM
jgi:hypothetical protein